MEDPALLGSRDIVCDIIYSARYTENDKKD